MKGSLYKWGLFLYLDSMAYCDYNNLNILIYQNLWKIPQDIDLIVCIPRSGMIIGTIISEYRNVPICTINEYINNVSTIKGTNLSQAKQFNSKEDYKHILLVDDTCSSGGTILNAKKIIHDFNNVKLTTFAVFAENEGKNIIDIYLTEANWPLFPYSVLKCSHFNSCFDIDGIFTEEVPANIDDDGEKYINFITTQRPLYIPQSEVLCLVTGRMEKYRDITEKWLAEHNVKYKNLFMCPAKTKEERLQMNPAKYKADIYKFYKADIFFESSLYEAKIIKQETNKPVFCTEIMNFI